MVSCLILRVRDGKGLLGIGEVKKQKGYASPPPLSGPVLNILYVQTNTHIARGDWCWCVSGGGMYFLRGADWSNGWIGVVDWYVYGGAPHREALRDAGVTPQPHASCTSSEP